MDSANIQRGLNPPLNEVSFKKYKPSGLHKVQPEGLSNPLISFFPTAGGLPVQG
ncbi:MAG: hypothetical protein AB1815_02945 [Bacillota bacterium]